MPSSKPLFRIAALAIALAAVHAHAAPRAFVASSGNDANAASGCTPALPCRSFQAAHGAVDAGGEIVALDTAGYGAVVITKSVSIIGNPGTVPSIAVSTGSGVKIETGVNVTLRNLNINGVGGTLGIEKLEGGSLVVENCFVSGFQTGVWILSASMPTVRITNVTAHGNASGVTVWGSGKVDISGSRLTSNSFAGLYVRQELGPGFNARVTITDSVVSGNTSGIVNDAQNGHGRIAIAGVTISNNAAFGINNRAVGPGGVASVSVGTSTITHSAVGFNNELGAGGLEAAFQSLGNNHLLQVDTPSIGTITIVSGS